MIFLKSNKKEVNAKRAKKLGKSMNNVKIEGEKGFTLESTREKSDSV